MSPSVDHASGVDNTTSENEQEQAEVNEREATELHDYAISSTVELNASGTRDNQTGRRWEDPKSPSALQTFWKRQVVATVRHEDCRDHFGTLHSYARQVLYITVYL